MEAEPEKPRQETPAPSRKVRMAWWFGIYLAGILVPSLSIFLHNLFLHHRDFVPLTLLTAIMGIFVFPIGLAGFLPNGGGTGERYAVAVIVLLAYAAYITHLVYTLKTKTRRAFRLLLLGLVIIVSISLVGCYKIMADMQ
jgi:hypothetical protein